MILDLTQFYQENPKKKYIKLKGKRIVEGRSFFNGPVFLDKKKFTYNDKNNYYRCGKHSIFLLPDEGNACYKFFIFYTKATKEEVKHIHKIHNRLAGKSLAPKSFSVCEVDIIVPEHILEKKEREEYPKRIRSRIKSSGKGYGLVLKKIQSLMPPVGGQKERIDKKTMNKIMAMCEKYKIFRRGSVENFMAECRDESNKIYIKNGFMFIDIDNRCTIGAK